MTTTFPVPPIPAEAFAVPPIPAVAFAVPPVPALEFALGQVGAVPPEPEPEPEPEPDPWAPADVEGLALWLDAADADTLTLSGATITEWRDKSGAERHAQQTGSENQRPTYTATGLNDLPAVQFDGSNDFLNFPFGMLYLLPEMTVLMVMRGPGQNNNAIFGPTGTNSIGLELLFVNIASWPTLVRINKVLLAETGVWRNDNEPSVSVIQASASESGGWINGVSSFTAAGIAPLNMNNVYAMGRYSGGFYATMHMAEFMIYGSAMSAENRQRAEGYLAHKWGLTESLPADHPYKAAAP